MGLFVGGFSFSFCEYIWKSGYTDFFTFGFGEVRFILGNFRFSKEEASGERGGCFLGVSNGWVSSGWV